MASLGLLQKPSPSFSPLAVRRQRAALIFDISPSKFDAWVREGKMPAGHKIDGVLLWDLSELRDAWDDLRARNEIDDGPNPFDATVA